MNNNEPTGDAGAGVNESFGRAPHPRLAVTLLAIAVLLGYWHTTDVPFYFDDFPGIVENPAVFDAGDWAAIWQYSSARFVGVLTFALNHSLTGPEPAGFHVVNILIHFLTAVALWGLLTGLVRSPGMGDSAAGWKVWLPLLVALLFVLHPLQTQAVTYIVQRLASLAALWYLAALAAYTWGRLRSDWRWFGLAAVFTLFAFFTKQNAATLPAAIILVELLFFRQLGVIGRLSVAAVVASAVGALVLVVQFTPLGDMLRETSEIGRSDYLATQMGVLWRYVSLFFLPIDQRLEYSIPLVTGPWPAQVYGQLAGHLSLIVVGFLLWRRAPLIAFGILFYYLAHLVESSFLPITDLAVEHRTYLPNAGLIIATVTGLAWFANRKGMLPVGVVAISAVLILSGWLTYQRNELWRDPVAFMHRDVHLSPDVERAWTSLGKELMRRGRFNEALSAFGKALNLARTEDGLEVRPETLSNAVMALHYTGQHKKAFEMARILPVKELKPVDRGKLHEVRGLALIDLNALEPARKELELSLKAWPSPNALSGMAVIEARMGNGDKARDLARQVVQAVPDHRVARDLLQELGSVRGGSD